MPRGSHSKVPVGWVFLVTKDVTGFFWQILSGTAVVLRGHERKDPTPLLKNICESHNWAMGQKR